MSVERTTLKSVVRITPSVVPITLSVVRTTLSVSSVVNIYSVGCVHYQSVNCKHMYIYSVGCIHTCLHTCRLCTLLGQLLTYTLSIVLITLSVVNIYSVGSTHYYITLSVVRIALLVIRCTMSVVHISRSVVNIYSVSSTHYSIGCSDTLLCELYALFIQL